MGKKGRKPKSGRKSPAEAVERAGRAIEQIAAREGTTPEAVRKHIQIAMLSGLASDDPETRAAWARIPKTGDVPTPEEVIAYYAERIRKQ